jgi:hypothetical protein
MYRLFFVLLAIFNTSPTHIGILKDEFSGLLFFCVYLQCVNGTADTRWGLIIRNL